MNLYARAIYLARLERGFSQRELALKAGVPQPNLSKIEKGRDFKVSTLSQLAYALDISVEDLIGGIEPIEINKKELFQRRNIEKAVACVIYHQEPPGKLKQAVELISALAGRKKGRYHSEKDAQLSWARLKKSFSDEEIRVIMARLAKAKQRTP